LRRLPAYRPWRAGCKRPAQIWPYGFHLIDIIPSGERVRGLWRLCRL
jgi:hypothetical protein